MPFFGFVTSICVCLNFEIWNFSVFKNPWILNFFHCQFSCVRFNVFFRIQDTGKRRNKVRQRRKTAPRTAPTQVQPPPGKSSPAPKDKISLAKILKSQHQATLQKTNVKICFNNVSVKFFPLLIFPWRPVSFLMTFMFFCYY